MVQYRLDGPILANAHRLVLLACFVWRRRGTPRRRLANAVGENDAA
jgi:hypothetical protein